jgi:hypothetical protein
MDPPENMSFTEIRGGGVFFQLKTDKNNQEMILR